MGPQLALIDAGSDAGSVPPCTQSGATVGDLCQEKFEDYRQCYVIAMRKKFAR